METRNSLTLVCNMLPVVDLRTKPFAVELKYKEVASVWLKLKAQW